MDAPLLTADFKEFLRLLNVNRVDYLLVGAYAVGLHGYPRATVDLDVWVNPTPGNAPHVIAALREFGFDTPTIEPQLFINPRSIVRFGVPPFRIEIMTAIDGVTYDDCWNNRETFDMAGLAVPVISLADLKINKLAAGRHKDLNDLENLP
ncbi:MAG: hypothetical protein Q8O42_12130 [Acidobacteriota bacterium]|nr:hypothetical protein [Acidobacteriota bacterium]